MRAWLRNSNGWQRLWIVISSLSLFYGILIFPFLATENQSQSRYEYRRAVEREMRNPECTVFMQEAFQKLTEPKYTDSDGRSGCYHIYNYRKYHNQTTVPYTEEVLNKDFHQQGVIDFFGLAGIGVLLALVFSGLIYGTGATIRWIRRGFASKNGRDNET